MLGIFREDQVEKGRQALLFSESGLGALEAQAGQIAKGAHILLRDGRHFGVLFPQDLGDQERINRISLRASDRHVAPGGGDDRIDHVNRVAGLRQALEQHHPVIGVFTWLNLLHVVVG